MIITDLVYGMCEVDSPVLIDLISSKPIQRLKGVAQCGPTILVMPEKFIRYEHSVGVMLLLRSLNASLE